MSREGQTFSIDDAIRESASEHPRGTLYWVPLSTDAFKVVRASIPTHLNGKKDQIVAYDDQAEVLYVSEEVTEEQERELRLSIGAMLRIR